MTSSPDSNAGLRNRMLSRRIGSRNLHLALGNGVAGFSQVDGGALEVETQSGARYPAEIVILALGARPDERLAVAAKLRSEAAAL